MANAANTRNVRNSKSRQYAQDRNKFGGSSAPKKDSPNYADKSMRSSADSSGQPKGYSSEPAPKTKPFTRTLETADAGGKYPVKPSSPKVASAGGSNIIKRPSSGLATKAGKLVFAGADAAKSGRLGRTAQIIAGALDPSELGDASLSNEASAQAVKGGAFKQDSEPKSKAVTPDVTSKLESTSPKTDYKPLKDMVSVKETPAASKPALKSGTSKPKGPTEGDRARAAFKEFKAWNDSRAPLDSDSTKAEDMNTQGKIEATEDLPANGMKKGGMTKRPPKPAKKVPPRKFASGGSVSRTSASKRGDGCASKGHTKGKYC